MSRLLLDENVSPALARALPGHDVIHVNDVGLSGAPDAAIMLWAAARRRTVVTHDHDFVHNLWLLRAGSPSVIKLVQRGPDGLIGAAVHAAHLRTALPLLERRLRTGAVVVLGARTITTERLPIAERVARTRGR